MTTDLSMRVNVRTTITGNNITLALPNVRGSLTANGFAPGPGVGCSMARRHRHAVGAGPWLTSHAKRQVRFAD